MVITKNQVEQILKTLPISYYCGRAIDIRLSDNESSFNPVSDIIQVSFDAIAKNMANLQDDSQLEKDVRTLLYHEVSHAILTPKCLQMSAIINTFEDERIETLLANYYMNVDFKDFCIRVNNFCGQAPTSAFDYFYQIVRFRFGPDEFVSRVSKIINWHQSLNANTKYTAAYTNDILDLYYDIEKDFTRQAKAIAAKQFDKSDVVSQSNTDSEQNNASKDVQIKQTLDDAISNNKQIPQQTNFIEHAKNKQHDDALVKSKHLIRSSVDEYYDAALQSSIEKLLITSKNTTKQNASAINTYSGIFNSRSVARQDYKFFVQQNRVGHVKQFAKVKLNLFIDCSGSFYHNDDTVNKLLNCLVRLEKSNSNFEFDLIHCSNGQRLATKDKRYQKSYGGTCLTKDISTLFKQLQKPDANNLNIVLYDGYMFECCIDDETTLQRHQRITVFNNANTILILDDENRFAEKYISNGRLILTDHYVKELIKNVLAALQILL